MAFPASLLLFAGAVGYAFAQSSPGLQFGQVPTAAQWNSYFASKVDFAGYIPAGRISLAGPTTFYVDGIDGNNSNSCVAAGTGACKTIQGAVNKIATNYDLKCNDVSLQLAGTGGTPQTYTENVVVPSLLGACDQGALLITGDTTTPANVIMTSASGTTLLVGSPNAAPPAMLGLQGVTITAPGGSAIQASDGARFRVAGNMTFGAALNAHIAGTRNSYVNLFGSYSISGGATEHLNILQSATLNNNAITVTLSGTPAFSTAFAVFSLNASSNMSATITFSGPATGPRYNVQSGAILNTAGQGPNYLPGNSPGSTATNGQYL